MQLACLPLLVCDLIVAPTAGCVGVRVRADADRHLAGTLLRHRASSPTARHRQSNPSDNCCHLDHLSHPHRARTPVGTCSSFLIIWKVAEVIMLFQAVLNMFGL